MVNKVLGKIFFFNLVLLCWFMEGIVIVLESWYTVLGRVGSASHWMYLWFVVLVGTLFRTLGGFIDDFCDPLGGTWAYVFGVSFMIFIIECHGLK